MLNLILIIGFYLLVSGATPFYCPVKLRFCVRSNSCIVVRFRPIFAIGQLLERALTPTEMVQRVDEMRDYLKSEISAQLQQYKSSDKHPDISKLNAVIHLALESTFIVFEGEV